MTNYTYTHIYIYKYTYIYVHTYTLGPGPGPGPGLRGGGCRARALSYMWPVALIALTVILHNVSVVLFLGGFPERLAG